MSLFWSCWIASIGCDEKFSKESLICLICINGCDLTRVMRWLLVHLEVVFYFFVFFHWAQFYMTGARSRFVKFGLGIYLKMLELLFSFYFNSIFVSL